MASATMKPRAPPQMISPQGLASWPRRRSPSQIPSDDSTLDLAMNLTGETKHEASGLPIGVKVDATSAKRPVRTTHSGRYVIVAPLDPLAHAQSLYEGTHGVNKE